MNTQTQAHGRRSSVVYKIGLTAAVNAVLTGAAGTFAAFTATTANSGNAIASGTVKIDQHTGAATLYNVTNTKPGTATVKCVRVTYTGSLTADVKFYISNGAVANGDKFNLTVERAVATSGGLTTLDGTMSCAGFGTGTGASTTTAYATGLLSSFPSSYATGLAGKDAAATWANNDWVDYRFTIVPVDDSTANARTTVFTSGTHTFTWEAQNN